MKRPPIDNWTRKELLLQQISGASNWGPDYGRVLVKWTDEEGDHEEFVEIKELLEEEADSGRS